MESGSIFAILQHMRWLLPWVSRNQELFLHSTLSPAVMFKHIGKKTAWDTWSVYDEVTEVFRCLSSAPSIEALTNAVPILERYTVIMYDRTSTCTSVNTARKDLFTRKGREIDNIPPTADALLQHAKRTVFQSGHCWGNCLKCRHNVLLLASGVG